MFVNKNKKYLSIIVCLLTSNSIHAGLSTNQVYFSVFGGAGNTNSTNFNMQGIAFKTDGPLGVNAMGRSDSSSTTMLGLNFGVESSSNPKAAFEVEAFYLNNTMKGALFNNTPRIPGHAFINTLPMTTGVFMANAILSLSKNKLKPYLGGGVGAARMSISAANSVQTTPFEPGINHFNSNPNAIDWTLAAQGKAGLGLQLTESLSVFGEYRLLYLSNSNYTFGSTVYPSHSATTNWTVKVNGVFHNLAAIGMRWRC